jgi:hypothetical protein
MLNVLSKSILLIMWQIKVTAQLVARDQQASSHERVQTGLTMKNRPGIHLVERGTTPQILMLKLLKIQCEKAVGQMTGRVQPCFNGAGVSWPR